MHGRMLSRISGLYSLAAGSALTLCLQGPMTRLYTQPGASRGTSTDLHERCLALSLLHPQLKD